MKKILILANDSGGLYKFRKELIEELKKDNDVYIALPYGEYIEKLKDLGCTYIRCDFNRRGTNPVADLKLYNSYRKIMKSIAPDVVLTYTIKPNVYGGYAAASLKIPYIANVTGLGTSIENGGLLSKITTTMYKAGLKKASCVFFQNEKNQKFFMERKLVSGKVRLIPGSGVNLQAHNFETYPDNSITSFLFVGRIMKDKGIEEVVGATKRLHDSFPQIELSIIGGSDEDYSAFLDDAGETGFIHYLGVKTDMHPFYTNASCIVLPSYHEGMANVLLEGASVGRPVIASRIAGCKEAFEEGVTGLGCEAESEDSLLEAMSKFMNLSFEERTLMGKKGRERMERLFDRKIVIEAYKEEINSNAER